MGQEDHYEAAVHFSTEKKHDMSPEFMIISLCLYYMVRFVVGTRWGRRQNRLKGKGWHGRTSV